jgi:hypothetical protein
MTRNRNGKQALMRLLARGMPKLLFISYSNET